MNTLNSLHRHPARLGFRGEQILPHERTRQWLTLLSIDSQKLQNIDYLHIAGTKGKGTTCLYCEQILQEYKSGANFPKRIGCLTSPHVSDIRDRIRINSEPVSKPLFSKYFFEVWTRLLELSTDARSRVPQIPGYPGFMTLLAFYIFAKENVDVAVIETGIGGERDSTNFIRPVVTGITSLALDHTHVLGSTIEDIAWHKAGIFKHSVPAYTVHQKSAGLRILQKRALEKEVTLQIVSESIITQLGLSLTPDLDYQRRNGALALSLVEAYLSVVKPGFKVKSSLNRYAKDFS